VFNIISDSTTLLSVNSVYGELYKTFQGIREKKPNCSARLFGIIMSYMKRNYRVTFTPSNLESVWLTEVDYDGIVESFSISKADRGSTEGRKLSFRMSMVILTDSVDFFVVFRVSFLKFFKKKS